MGVRKAEEKHLRKLFKVGYQRTIAVTLPIEEVRKLGWRPGQMVSVKLQNGALVVRDHKN